MAKKRIIKDYESLTEEILQAVKLKYPTGYEQHLVTYNDKEGKIVSALPFEAADAHYLIRMTVQEAKRYVREDEDLEEETLLRDSFKDLEEAEVEEYDGSGEDDDGGNDVEDESDHIIVTRRRHEEEAEDVGEDPDY